MNNAMKAVIAIATMATLATLGGCASRRSAELRDPGKIFAAADANGDGIVTREEFLTARAANFAKYDRNEDGYIDSEDVPKRLRARQKAGDRLGELITRFDSNGDRRIGRAEFVDGPTAGFDRADTDRDGELSQAEVAASSRR